MVADSWLQTMIYNAADFDLLLKYPWDQAFIIITFITKMFNERKSDTTDAFVNFIRYFYNSCSFCPLWTPSW